MSTVRLARLGPEPIDVAEHLAAVTSPRAGAVATFVGQVRDHDPDATGVVVRLEYLAHPDAPAVLARLAHEAGATADVLAVAVSHRTGVLAVGEVAIVACVAAAHRGPAFAACSDLVERVKAELPVWKKQVVADGTHAWVGV